MKADLHVHSAFSKRPSYYILKKLGAAESYVPPRIIYETARQKGMDFVTISDHNTIEGCLDIAHLPGTFISEEVTTYFPDNGCKIHILALNITEAHHNDIQHLRKNIYDLQGYLNREAITHVVAHPLFSINDRLTISHVEQLLLLFNNFELNGTRDTCQNAILVDILTHLSSEKISQLSVKHDLSPVGPHPWKKGLTGGSDDHSGSHVAAIHTEVEGDGDIQSFLNGVNQRKSRVRGTAYHPRMMAHTFYSIAYQFYKHKFNLDALTTTDTFFAFIDHLLKGPEIKHPKPNRFSQFIRRAKHREEQWHQHPVLSNVCIQAARDVLLNDASYQQMAKGKIHDTKEKVAISFRFVNQAADEIISRIGDTVLKKISSGNFFDMFAMLGAGGSLYTMLAPYFIAYGLFTKDRRFCRNIHHAMGSGNTPQNGLKVAHFTDTLMDVNGVAKTLRLQAKMAADMDKSLTMITCGPDTMTDEHLKSFPPIGTFEIPEYSELKLYYPPVLKMIDYCYEKEFNRIHIATPGPVGLSALAIARILKLPVYGTYHTAFPQYVINLTGDTSLEDLMWTYMIWFYNQMDVVFVPSKATGDELEARGIRPDKIRFYRRGIDVESFHPTKRNGFFQKRFNLNDDRKKLLYVGRVSREKNLDELCHIFTRIYQSHPDTCLVVVGDGPYLATMKEELKGLPVLFTGFMAGEDLRQAYASSDMFIFPSTTDTFGNVVLEAQASGVPVIVTDQGGPRENLLPEKTGYVVPGHDIDAFVEKISHLLTTPALLKRMGIQARAYMEGRNFKDAFNDQWMMYHDPVSPPTPIFTTDFSKCA